MNYLLTEFSDDDLIYILQCEKIKQLKPPHFSLEKSTKLFTMANNLNKSKIKHKNVLQALFPAITDVASHPLSFLWATMLILTSISIIPLAIITTTIAAVTLAVGAIYFVSHYIELKKKVKKNQEFCQLNALQLQVAEELIARLSGENQPEQQPDKDYLPIKKDKFVLAKIKKSIGVGILIGGTLYGTYYLGIVAIIAAFGFTAAASMLMGPIGLGVAGIIFTGIGIYFGYKYYQVSKNNQYAKMEQKQLLNNLNAKKQQCAQLLENSVSPQPSRVNKKMMSIENKKPWQDTEANDDKDDFEEITSLPQIPGRRTSALRNNSIYRHNIQHSKPIPISKPLYRVSL